ncbi:nucleotidyltransferase family protein [Vulcanisaeta thermophila]|uniref:nucleotidyltransferase family protein n=1 Tax=Vulcanisaeta thermophila TaxID=867917 RepID=UPI000853EE56|nr:nucleotidyltransferase family protein [Vulcanisaeta thermophila]
MRVGAIVLAAGEGRRFGGNKLLAKVNNEPIIIRVLRALEGLDRVVVVGAYAEELIPLLRNEVVIYNPWFREGMSTSLKLGVRFFQDYDAVLVVLADMPLITRETIAKIINAYHEGCAAVVPTHGGVRGNPVLIHKSLYPEIMGLSGDVGAREILRNKTNICTVECGPEVTVDVDHREDLDRVSRVHGLNQHDVVE